MPGAVGSRPREVVRIRGHILWCSFAAASAERKAWASIPKVMCVYQPVWERTVKVDKSLPLLLPSRRARARADLIKCNVRYVLLHMIEETARHAGYADIIRETLDGSRGI